MTFSSLKKQTADRIALTTRNTRPTPVTGALYADQMGALEVYFSKRLIHKLEFIQTLRAFRRGILRCLIDSRTSGSQYRQSTKTYPSVQDETPAISFVRASPTSRDSRCSSMGGQAHARSAWNSHPPGAEAPHMRRLRSNIIKIDIRKDDEPLHRKI